MWRFWSFLDVEINYFHHIWDSFWPLFLQIFFFPLANFSRNSHSVYVAIHDIPQICEDMIIIFHSFSYLFPRLCNWPIFKLTFFFSLPTQMCWVWAFVLFKSTISIFFSNNFYFFIDVFYLVWYCFEFFILLFVNVLFDSLNIFSIADLKSLSSKSNIWDSSGTVL